MILMGLKNFLEINSLDNFLNKNGGYNNVLIIVYCIVYYLEVNNDVFDEVVICFVDMFVFLLFFKENVEKEVNVVNVEMVCVKLSDGYLLNSVNLVIFNFVYLIIKFIVGNKEIFLDKLNSLL